MPTSLPRTRRGTRMRLVKAIVGWIKAWIAERRATGGYGLVGYWTFDGGSIDWHTNTAADISGQGNTGTLVSMSTTTSPVGGKIGQALTFNNSGTVDLTANVSNLNFSGPATVSGWFRSGIEGSQFFEISQGENPDDYLDVCLGDTCTGTIANELITVHKYVDGVNHYIVAYTSANRAELIDNKWHHVSVVWNGSNTKIYLDGSSKPVTTSLGTDTGQYGGINGANSAAIASLTTGGVTYYATGTFDDVRIYNRALSATEVNQLYNAGR
jgi:Concanavalin A-like lectin/glucanases superfamily